MRKFMTLLVAIILTCSGCGVSAREVFTDVPETDWAAPFIYNLVDRNIVGGYGDGTFKPNDPVQRCEYAKMLVNIAEIERVSSSTSPYCDVPVGEWYFDYVNSALSLITGYTRGGQLYFEPETNASREDVAVAMIKALGIDVTEYVDPEGYLSARFSDWQEISSHNRAYIVAAVDKGIITGDMSYGKMATFRPSASIIRAEVAIILCRAFPDGSDVQANEYN